MNMDLHKEKSCARCGGMYWRRQKNGQKEGSRISEALQHTRPAPRAVRKDTESAQGNRGRGNRIITSEKITTKMKRELRYNLAPKTPGEVDSNRDVMNRWERAQGMKMSDLTDEEWLDVVESILCLTPWEAREYLEYLRASGA